MSKRTFEKSSSLRISVEEAFAWHERPGAFDRFMPPWQEAKLIKRGGIQDGEEIITEVKIGPLWQRWIARMYGYEKNKVFCDEQLKGPFKSWHHQHLFQAEGAGCRMTDKIEYELPFGALGNLFGENFATKSLERLFAYRHRILEADLQMRSQYAMPPKTILLTGSTGLVGTQLTSLLTTQGHRVIPLVRKSSESETMAQLEGLEINGLEIDAVVHLAGESISSGRWTDELKQRIYDSRIKMTTALSEALSRMKRKPSVFISASAIGYYGNRGQEELNEFSKAGEGFLVSVCKDWEASTRAASEAGIRVVHPRIGIVLSPQGGALKKMLPAFRMGLGGVLGDGEQWMSWISIDDLLYLILHSIASNEVRGPINAVTGSIKNKDFTRILAETLHRIMGPKAPAFVLRTFAGEMADALLLASTRVRSSVAESTQFKFRYPTLESTLHHCLGV